MLREQKKREDKSPRVLLQKLEDLLNRWIQPALMFLQEIMDTFLLGQFLTALEENTQRWVCPHHPKTSRGALRLVEDFDCAQNEAPREKGEKPGTLVNARPSVEQGD